VIFPTASAFILLADGRLVEPGLRYRAPLVRDEFFVRESSAGADRAIHNTSKYPVACTCCQASRRKVARLQLSKLGEQLTELTDVQARYIGVEKQGPYKVDQYRY